MLFADAHVHETLREALFKKVRPRAFGHGCRDGQQAVIFFRQLDQRLAEDAGKGRRLVAAGDEQARFRLKVAHTMEMRGIFLRWGIALALAGAHMQQHRPVFHGCRHLQMTAQGGQVVPVHRPDIGEAEGFEQHAGREKGFEAPFAAHGVQGQFLADTGDGA